jgi:hypothetical protein
MIGASVTFGSLLMRRTLHHRADGVKRSSARRLIIPRMTKLLLLPIALAVALLAGSTSPSAAVPVQVVPVDDCLKKPARVSKALRPLGAVRVSNRGMHARRPVCGGGFQVVGIIGPAGDGRCLWTFYDPYSSPRVWSHWDYCP